MIGRPDPVRMIEWPELPGWLIECPKMIVIDVAGNDRVRVPGPSWMIGRPDPVRMIEWPEYS